MICQYCGKEIKRGEHVVEVRYGTAIVPTMRAPQGTKATRKDFFHRRCDVAIVGKDASI